MQQIEFYKYHGTGNDFILIDSYNKNIRLSQKQIENLCNRHFGIGADGLMVLRKKENYDFEMDFYNSDGNPGSMCGNGGRCIVAFAHDLNLIKAEAKFWAPDGEHLALFKNHDEIALKMADVNSVEKHDLGLFMDTGSPHLIVYKNKTDKLDVVKEGREIRFNKTYEEKGVNVNFCMPNYKTPKVFTYERGVENETYSCGTGSVATALSLHIIDGLKSPISLETKGGLLKIEFNTIENDNYNKIWLIGPAKQVFKGTINIG